MSRDKCIPQALFIMEFPALFFIRSKVAEIGWPAVEGGGLLQCDQKDTEIVRLKNREVEIEDFEFV